MPFFFSQDKQPKGCSRHSTSLLRRFNDMYKPSTSAHSALLAKPQCAKVRRDSVAIELPVHISLFNSPHDFKDFSGDSSSNSSHSDANSSPQTLELSPDPVETSPSAHVPAQRPHIKPLRPALKQTTSWNSTSSSTRSSTHELHVSFVIPSRPDSDVQRTAFAMHPLFAYTHLDHAPISCDIAYPPSSRSILDRGSRCPIPYDTLDEPATVPAVYTQLVLKCALFPWDVVVRPTPVPSPSTAKYSFRRSRPITNLDVLVALHDALSERVTADEWSALGPRSRAQRRIARAYEARCVRLGGGWEAGVRRIDWLEGRTRLVGIEMDVSSTQKESGASDVARLVFKTPA